MQFIKQEELDILKNYPLNEAISIKDYLVDFILKNPLNFPTSAYIMKKKIVDDSAIIKDMYSRNNIEKRISKYCKNNRSEYNTIWCDMLLHNLISLTPVVMQLLQTCEDSKIYIHQINDNKIYFSIHDGYHRISLLTDEQFSSLICYHDKNFMNICQLFINQINEPISKISNDLIKFDHWYFEFTNSDELINIVNTARFLCGADIPSWYHKDINETTTIECSGSIMNDYNILRLCGNNYKSTNKNFVNKEKLDEKKIHINEVTNFAGIDKMGVSF